MPTTQKKVLPVLIVGAGPTGLSLAIECCRHHVPFRLIDQNLERSTFSKALGVWHGTMQMLEAQGILDEFLKVSVLIDRVCFADQGRPVGSIKPQEIAHQKGPIVLAQSETERLLEAKLNALGAKVERGISLSQFREMDDMVEVKLKHADGKEEIISVSWLAGCDGARSICRKTLEQQQGVEFKGYTEPENFILADVEYEGPYTNNQIMVSWGKDNAVALFPVTPKILRVVSRRKDNQNNTPPTLEEVSGLMQKYGPQGLKLKNPTWLSLFKINERLSSHYQKGRVFLLGDAAHIHSPAGGQGMNTGMQDAFNLGWKLAFLLKVPHKQSILESYEAERRPIAEAVIKESSRKLHFAMKQNRLFRMIKDTLLPLITRIKPVQDKMVAELSELFIEYKQSPLVMHDESLPKLFRPGKKWLNDAPSKHFGNKHILVKFAKTAAEFKAFHVIVEPFLKPLNAELVECIDMAQESNWYLIRPDQFIAAGGKGEVIESLRAYCSALYS